MKDKTLGIIGMALTICGTGIGIISGKIKDKQNENMMNKKISEEVAKALMNLKKGD